MTGYIEPDSSSLIEAGLAFAKAISAEQDPFRIVGEVMRDYDTATEVYCKNDGYQVESSKSGSFKKPDKMAVIYTAKKTYTLDMSDGKNKKILHLILEFTSYLHDVNQEVPRVIK